MPMYIHGSAVVHISTGVDVCMCVCTCVHIKVYTCDRQVCVSTYCPSLKRILALLTIDTLVSRSD